MKSWNVGDRAIVVGAITNKAAIGMTVTITNGPQLTNAGEVVYEVDIPTIYDNQLLWPMAWFLSTHLKPIPYDGNKASTWDECEFKPAVMA